VVGKWRRRDAKKATMRSGHAAWVAVTSKAPQQFGTSHSKAAQRGFPFVLRACPFAGLARIVLFDTVHRDYALGPVAAQGKASGARGGRL
jgi:hypothetical protein